MVCPAFEFIAKNHVDGLVNLMISLSSKLILLKISIILLSGYKNFVDLFSFALNGKNV
jgi:hypothetical protein